MNYKKSMRIFWFSLCLLLAAGMFIIASVQYRSQKKLIEGAYDHKERTGPSGRMSQPETTTGEDSREKAASFAVQPYTQKEQTSVDSGIPQTGQNTVEYRFELKVKNGYLDVYHFHTENLFFHTGIPYSAMTVNQRQELENGKYFVNEQELYGYLESCTS